MALLCGDLPEAELISHACQVCGDTTREQKPFCSRHVTHHPYAAALVAQLARQREEHQAVAREGPAAVDTRGLTASELLRLLHQRGPQTVQRLSRELNLAKTLVTSYARALAEVGLVELSSSRRRRKLLVAACELVGAGDVASRASA